MKPLRIFMLVALLVLPLFASSVLADFTADTVNIGFAGNKKISENTINQPILGFWIPKSGADTLKTVIVKSYIERAFSVQSVKLWVETNGTPGWQITDTELSTKSMLGRRFETQDSVIFNGLNRVIKASRDTFYVTIDAYTDSVKAHPDLFDTHGLDVVIEEGRIQLGTSSGNVNLNRLNNLGYNPGVGDAPPFFNPFKLIFDTMGPQFNLHICVSQAGICPIGKNTIHQTDTVTLCATDISPDIVGPITIVDSKKTFLLDLIQLKSTDNNAGGDSLGCWGEDKAGTPCGPGYNTVFIIPDKKNTGTYPGIDADTGQWEICAYATDSAGNTDTLCIMHAPDLTWKIDTRKPNIDSVQVLLIYDANGDGIAALGDSIQIIGWGLSNPWQPELEVDSMIVDMRRFCKGWIKLDDVLNNNRVFRKRIKLDVPCDVDTTDCDLNKVTVWAWDNACNYDTLEKGYCGSVDLNKPGIDLIVYEYNRDYDTTFACIGIGDKVHIQADVSGSDIQAVTADMKDAGIDALDRTALPLPNKGGGVYDTIWTVTEPPIDDGKDANNCSPPSPDADYSVRITACDDAGNCSTLVSPQLNRTLDTRRPRAIGFNCPDSIPCAIHAQSLPHGIIQLYWNRACDECDAFYYYIYASSDNGVTWDSMGSTYDNEFGNPNYNFWHSEMLPAGYYQFKIKTEDDCGNMGPFSCAVAALADTTPPNACIVYPDSGDTFGFPFVIKARSEDQDIQSVALYYRLWPNYPSDVGRSQWYPYGGNMPRLDQGFVFIEDYFHLHNYQGWIEVLPLSCDVIGNCQDTIRAYDEACLDDSAGDLVPGHFLAYWDTTNSIIQVVSVNDTISPQTVCGFNVSAETMNQVIVNVSGAEATDLFTIDVRAIVDNSNHRIDYRNHVTMPCTLMVSVQNWDQGTRNLYVHATKESNGHDCVPDPLIIPLCVPPQKGPCIKITDPVEWQRVPCSKTDKTNICITAETTPGCNDTVSQVEFRWSSNGEPPWYYIGEDITDIDHMPAKGSAPSLQSSWHICWNNKELIDAGTLHDGDQVYFIAIAYDQYHVADTSKMVRVVLDCKSPNIQLLMEPLYHTCTQKDSVISCEPLTFKAIVLDTVVDITHVSFYAKKHSDPDIFAYWHKVAHKEVPDNMNLWSATWDTPCLPDSEIGKLRQMFGLEPGMLYDFRIGAEDQADNEFLDYDEDGRFDDSTFNMAVALGAGKTLMVDGEAPQVAISMVADSLAPIYNVNPSRILNGSGKAYVKAHDPITIWIVPEPSEDTCEVYKVEYWIGYLDSTHLWTSIDTTAHCDSTCLHDTCEGYPNCNTHCDQWKVDCYCYVDTNFTESWRVDTLWYMAKIGTKPNNFAITGNPWDWPEFVPHYMMEDGYLRCFVKAILYDSLGNSSQDQIKLYILDVDPTQALITWPLNDDYVYGNVDLHSEALNGYEICQVKYQYRPDGGTEWIDVLNGISHDPQGWGVTWSTLDLPDGKYCLRAVATDCSNNVDQNPHTICVHVANTQPTVVLDNPRQCSRTCPNDTVDTLGYVGGTVVLSATAASTSAPIYKVQFYYKGIFEYPNQWTWIGTDYFPTGGKYSIKWCTSCIDDGRYQVMARVFDASNISNGDYGRYNDSAPITVSVDNHGPFAQIISIDGNSFPNGMDITKGKVIDIELAAIDSTSPDGWTRCYNSGLTALSVCIENCKRGEEITKCLEIDTVTDGIHHVSWNTSGLQFHGCSGCYYLYVKAYDCLGNETISNKITVYVSDVTAPITTVGGFDENYIYGYSSERLAALLFEYAPKGTSQWTPIGWSSDIDEHCYPEYLYKTTWDPTSLADGDYWVRVISDDSCSNQNDSLAPIAQITVAKGVITPYNPGILGDMTFEKNWCVGGMHGIVRQTCSYGTPVVIAKYNKREFECIDMQYHLQNTSDYAGSFNAEDIDNGGPAYFFSSLTVTYVTPPSTGEPLQITYLNQGSFDVAEVKTDLGTHGVYQKGCVEVTIQGGAVSSNEYIWVAPTELAWAPVTQPDIKPIGDNDGFATYVSFTDCYYCCGGGGYATSWFGKNFGWEKSAPMRTAPKGTGGDESGNCCLNEGRYAKIKLCYDNTITTDKAHLAVMWWDCENGEFKSDNIFYPTGVEGFNTTNHTVEFATTCLNGPFAVVEIQPRHCSGSIAVNMLQMEPYCNGYTNATPQFKAMITDNVEGTDGIDRHSIQFKTDLFNAGDLVTIYDGSHYEDCHKWAKGFGSFPGAGYDKVSGIFRAGWSDSTYLHSSGDDNDEWNTCDQCYQEYLGGDYHTYCKPMYPLAEGAHIASVTASNDHIQTCTDTLHFNVDTTKPKMVFADSIGAYVTKNPHICMYLSDIGSGIDKSSIYVDVFGDNYTKSDPTSHSFIATVHPDQMHWVNDTTVCFDFTFEYTGSYGFLHLYVYGGPNFKCSGDCPTSYYGYTGGITDCVGNRLDPFWRYFTVDSQGPTIAFDSVYSSLCDAKLRFVVTDDKSGVLSVTVSEDGTLKENIIQDASNPNYWWYTPTHGAKKATIEATDKLGNKSYYSFDLKADCSEPAVKIENNYVCKNPTIRFWVTDSSGVDWSSVNVYIDGCGGYCSYFAPDLTSHINKSTGLVTLDACNLDCTDGATIKTYVYSGTSKTGSGPCDLDGNCGTYRLFTFVVDAVAPVIVVSDTTTRPVRITITDARSGVDWSSLEFFEDNVLVCEGLSCNEAAVVIDTAAGLIQYNPVTSGKNVEVRVKDKTGCNLATKTFRIPSASDEVLAFGQPHNSPNPFDPRAEVADIYPDLTKDAYVTIKIYDFAGEYVREICKDEWMSVGSYKPWDGRTDGGTMVGNGTYLCYIHAKAVNGDPKTAVVKITVLMKDK